jgi:DNA-binding transcriptional MerR regulator
VKTLRYYDELGLLKPVEVDRFTGYRYYSADQLPRLNRILALKDLGLSLEQIARLLNEKLTVEQMRGMLRLKQIEAHARVRDEQERLARMETRLRQIEEEGKMPTYEVVVKKVPALRVASIRDTIPAYSQQQQLWHELDAYLTHQRLHVTRPCFALYHDTEYRERAVDAQVCFPVGAAARSRGRVSARTARRRNDGACCAHRTVQHTQSSVQRADAVDSDKRLSHLRNQPRDLLAQHGTSPSR